MFYIFPQNKKYMISKDLVVKLDGKVIETIGSKITIEIYGVEREVDLLWMYGMSLWNIELPEKYKEAIYNIEFKPISLNSHKVKEDLVAIFKNPIVIKDKYRLLAHVPRYAVSKDGTVYDLIKDKVIKAQCRSSYRIVHNNLTGKVYNVHRLVALAWIPNDDFISKPLVNHIDGDKTNNHYTNLEWCNFSYNVRHAIATGLTPQADSYLVLDMETNEEKLFYSVSDLSKYVNLNTIPHLSSRIARHSQYVLLKRYLIKSAMNNSPWIRDVDLNNNHTAKNATTATNIEALDLATGKVIVGTVSELSVMLNINKDTLTGIKTKYKQHNGYGYIFRDPSYMKWSDIEVIDNTLKPKEIVAINVNTKEEYKFKSLREASRFLECDKKNISRRLNQNKEYKSYIFKTI